MKRLTKTGVLAVLFLITLLVSTPLHADMLRCGSEVIQRGEPISKVIHYCGEPAWVSYGIGFPYGITTAYSSGFETWMYNFGPTEFMYTLTFRDGILIKIEREEHGY